MPSIVTHKFRQFNADQFFESLSEAGPSYLYMFIGRIRPWGDDSSPPAPSDAFANTEYDFWRDMMSAKRVTSADSSFVIERKNWTTGTIYNEYDPENPNLLTSANGHYVMTSDFNVYKCLFNNNGQTSYVEPAGTSVSITTPGLDKYKWKYMYSVSAGDALKFVTDDWIPVKRVGTSDDGSNQWDVEQAAANGAIDIIDVVTPGAAYTDHDTGTLSLVTSNAQMTLAASAIATQGSYTGSVLYLTGGAGAGLQANIISYSAGKVVTLTEPFSTTPTTSTTYSVAPKVVITGDGTGAQAICTMNTSPDTVYSVSVTNVGQDYSQAVVTFSANAANYSAPATGKAFIPPPGGHGNNAVTEFGGHNVLINAQFDKTESGKFTVVNDFRKIGLLRDPLLLSGAIATATRFDQSANCAITGLSGAFVPDEVITGGTSLETGVIIQANTSEVRFLKTSFSLLGLAAETITGGTSGATATTSGVQGGELLEYSGELLYSEYRGPISRAADQIEDVKLVINF